MIPLPTAAEITAAPIPWIDGSPPDPSAPEARVLFSRRIARRNFAGSPFWISCPPEACARLAARAREYAETHGLGDGLPLAALAPDTIGTLRERFRLPELPGAFPGKRDFKRLFTGSDAAEHVLFGEAEHWIRIRVSARLPDSGDLPNEEDNGSEFARSEDWGWLTSDPVFCGPGVQFEAALHLPALAAGGSIAQAQRAMDAMGFALHPLSLRNPGTAEAGFFRLHAGGSLGTSRENAYEEAATRFASTARGLLDAETVAWERWLAREPNLLDDRMHRALRLLQEARRMDYAELLFLSSFARAGVYAGLFPSALLGRLEELRVRSQPFHLGAGKSGDVEEENLRRAALARSLLRDA